ncbi:PREDICTED: uncharacterized protein LOC109484276 [Branchiostoma belcheri]|uniref:Uncharacterized protein LOC109484276 n=1 Tax=Branchiostoma belcheri TaxID=7741 RepID=A0A6P5A1D0_BRABE|nr:PREDICTED: uncharacterized protein LOC109484276 [Branchiostoma belcheri]
MATDKYLTASQKAVDCLLKTICQPDFRKEHKDVAFYFKSVTSLLLAGKHKEANFILDHIRATCRKGGDFVSPGAEEGQKSANGAYNEFWSYANGWIAMGAVRLQRFDVAYPAYRYLEEKFFHRELGGGTVKPLSKTEPNIVEVISTSHLGMVFMSFGDLDKAWRCGENLTLFTKKNLHHDDDPNTFYLRMDDKEKLIKDFPAEAAAICAVKATEPNQLYFFIGYPIAFLAKLFVATGEDKFRDCAEELLEFCMRCDESIYSSNFSHKVGWGAACLAAVYRNRNSKKEKYIQVATKIADHLVSLQSDRGSFLDSGPEMDNLDQTAEISVWLREIATELDRVAELDRAKSLKFGN